MNPRLKDHYEVELAHLREAGADFAALYPGIASRLQLGPDVCPDPFVERLLEGVAFLNARVQLKFEAEFPRFTQSLLETVYPHFLAPLPSMLIAQFKPQPDEPSLASGFTIPRGTALRCAGGRGAAAACVYRTAHELSLWPLLVRGARYLTRDINQLSLPATTQAPAALQLTFASSVDLSKLELDRLPMHLVGAGDLPYRLYESLIARCTGVYLQTGVGSARRTFSLGERTLGTLDEAVLAPLGFRAEEALLPVHPCSFEGYRLLAEYFRFPQRFLFAEIRGLRRALERCKGDTFDLVFTFEKEEERLKAQVTGEAFQLFCTPAVNLVRKVLSPIEISDREPEFHLVPDKSRPLDYEVHTVLEVAGQGREPSEMQTFAPFYFRSHAASEPGSAALRGEAAPAFYTVHRQERNFTPAERLAIQRQEAKPKYSGSDAYISLVDPNHAPWRPHLKLLTVTALCTNRHLPLELGPEFGRSLKDFNLEVHAPVEGIRCLSGPTVPVPAQVQGEQAWRMISHLTLNYLSLKEGTGEDGAAALREILSLYGSRSEETVRRQLLGLSKVTSGRVHRRVCRDGSPLGFVRGLHIDLELRETEFSGSGSFLFGSVLERFLAKYVSINSFTETALYLDHGRDRTLVKQWPPRLGLRQEL